MSEWGSPVEVERRKRIFLSVAAYAYEFENDILMQDHEFDELAYSLDTSINTGDLVLDSFFREEFDPCTGQWIQQHPDIVGVEQAYKRRRARLGNNRKYTSDQIKRLIHGY